jgi:hypothetical protein
LQHEGPDDEDYFPAQLQDKKITAFIEDDEAGVIETSVVNEWVCVCVCVCVCVLEREAGVIETCV